MNIQNSDIAHLCLETIELSHSTYYLFKKFIVAEINEGVVYRWELAREVIDRAHDFYGAKELALSYISNRINSYSVRPQDWLTFFKNDYNLRKIAFVTYTEIGYANIIFEKLFIKNRLKKFKTLRGFRVGF